MQTRQQNMSTYLISLANLEVSIALVQLLPQISSVAKTSSLNLVRGSHAMRGESFTEDGK